jgi:hypothetical protein
VRDGPIGLLHVLIRFDIDQGSVDIQKQRANFHDGVRKMILASSTSRRTALNFNLECGHQIVLTEVPCRYIFR